MRDSQPQKRGEKSQLCGWNLGAQLWHDQIALKWDLYGDYVENRSEKKENESRENSLLQLTMQERVVA